MEIKMYKSAIGWSEYKEGDDKHCPSHVLISNEIYSLIINEIEQNRQKVIQMEETLQKQEKVYQEEIEKLNKTADRRYHDLLFQCEMDRSTADRIINKLKEECKEQKKNNDNLFRINKERSNSQRKIQPKKEHHGYKLVGKISEVKTLYYHDKQIGPVYTSSWSSTIETPYEILIPYDVLKKRVMSELTDTGILAKFGIYYFVANEDQSFIWRGTYLQAKENSQGENMLYDYNFIANINTGYWEFHAMTLDPIEYKESY